MSRQFTVTGMNCAACSAKVEKTVLALPNVQSCSVNLLTGSLIVEGMIDESEIINAVRQAGYGITSSTKQISQTTDDFAATALKKRLILSAFLLLVLMYFSMGQTMLQLPLPCSLTHPLTIALLQGLVSAVVLLINRCFIFNGINALWQKNPNMNTLVALGSLTAYGFSLYVVFQMISAPTDSHEKLHQLYFEAAAMIPVIISLGKWLEALSKGKTTNALKRLISLSPQTATVLRNQIEEQIPTEQVQVGDILLIRSGESIPVDAIILEGSCTVDESALTGESIPVDKKEGDRVFSATLNQVGFIRCRALRVGEDTTLAAIIKLVSEASSSKAPIAKIADRIAGIFVPIVLGIAFVTFIVWIFLGASLEFALMRAGSVLLISCPCALGLATPVAIMVGSGVGALHGLLFKTAISLEETGKASICVLDKTGTITQGVPSVTDVHCADSISPDELMALAASLECKSEHPLAKAIVRHAVEKSLSPLHISNVTIHPGKGISGLSNQTTIYGGNLLWISQFAEIPAEIIEKSNQFAEEGKTPIYFCKEQQFLGLIAVADTIKPESQHAIAQLKAMGLHPVMLTGDNEKTAHAIGKLVGIDHIVANVAPTGKEEVIRELRQQGKVIMVGDGINDAPALTSADIGIAIGTGTEIAIDAADIVLTHSRLSDVVSAIELSRQTLRCIHQNLFWAFCYNVIGIPLAAGVFVPILGWEMNPMFGAAAMSCSSVCVVLNALRLNWVRLSSPKSLIGNNPVEKEIYFAEQPTVIHIRLSGVRCPKCEQKIRTRLEQFPELISAEVSHLTQKAILTLRYPVEEHLLVQAITELGFSAEIERER